MITDFALLGW